MVAMSHPASRPFTVSDLEAMPDDGRRYELIDGELLVSPAPGWAHQEAIQALCARLRAACPGDLRVLAAPFSVRIDTFNDVQPDVLVARFTDLTEPYLPRPPLLAVEVLSPTSGLRDRSLKKAVYERMGVISYWLVDPDRVRPALTVFELRDGAYEQEAAVTGDDAWTTRRPFRLEIRPADLVAGLRP